MNMRSVKSGTRDLTGNYFGNSGSDSRRQENDYIEHPFWPDQNSNSHGGRWNMGWPDQNSNSHGPIGEGGRWYMGWPLRLKSKWWYPKYVIDVDAWMWKILGTQVYLELTTGDTSQWQLVRKWFACVCICVCASYTTFAPVCIICRMNHFD